MAVAEVFSSNGRKISVNIGLRPFCNTGKGHLYDCPIPQAGKHPRRSHQPADTQKDPSPDEFISFQTEKIGSDRNRTLVRNRNFGTPFVVLILNLSQHHT